ncbi:hypothetical protein SBI_01267 [Streptomyces bingchenggensis BCW-1]|uniref:Uncharacterized protein n=1 Tax=Streptomyces bingchenggensis (strain BCW-1) TaxID=749414 RepID=D7CA60_STRBB|nr:hypothetical protein SBI_01267 [Streptomyces bingchenggensis BCW-1]
MLSDGLDDELSHVHLEISLGSQTVVVAVHVLVRCVQAGTQLRQIQEQRTKGSMTLF